MAERRVVVASTVGLHARPAAVFVRAASETGLPVTLSRHDGRPVDARSILSVVTLDVKHGEEVLLRAQGDGAEAALDRLAELLANG
ncbi:MAG TPA: HPr family phosphocarrier protein [Micromonosporaceae bacterium]|nr:HPr family phosphocarrier protein [Micromonosporaceae bacterium]